MAEYKIISSDQVEFDLKNILEYLIEQWDVIVAKKFFLQYLIKINTIKINPKTGRISIKNGSIRSIQITKYNRLYYTISEDTIYLSPSLTIVRIQQRISSIKLISLPFYLTNLSFASR